MLTRRSLLTVAPLLCLPLPALTIEPHVLGCRRGFDPDTSLVLRYLEDAWCQGSGPYYRNRALDTFMHGLPLTCDGCEDDYLTIMGRFLTQFREDLKEDYMVKNLAGWTKRLYCYERYHAIRRLIMIRGKVSKKSAAHIRDNILEDINSPYTSMALDTDRQRRLTAKEKAKSC